MSQEVAGSNPVSQPNFCPNSIMEYYTCLVSMEYGFDSHLGLQFYGVYSVEVRTLDCDSGSTGSIPVRHPNLFACMSIGSTVCFIRKLM